MCKQTNDWIDARCVMLLFIVMQSWASQVEWIEKRVGKRRCHIFFLNAMNTQGSKESNQTNPIWKVPQCRCCSVFSDDDDDDWLWFDGQDSALLTNAQKYFCCGFVQIRSKSSFDQGHKKLKLFFLSDFFCRGQFFHSHTDYLFLTRQKITVFYLHFVVVEKYGNSNLNLLMQLKCITRIVINTFFCLRVWVSEKVQ